MEQWVRVRNEQDHQLLRWLVEAVGEAAIAKAAQACARGDAKPYLSTVCRQLGVSVPRLSTPRSQSGGVGEQHLQAIYRILQRPGTPARGDWQSTRSTALHQ
ncbi:hypothetical protein SBC1_76330 (plasmid) [Caballeronia sp. SBC1]|nr:hypothetical protein SBC2_79510 [Caballeronia sp. SBC2]QIN67586.1 hypothetical protein SBC1_76330 [Caballeronia sp. SBC1]